MPFFEFPKKKRSKKKIFFRTFGTFQQFLLIVFQFLITFSLSPEFSFFFVFGNTFVIH